MLAKIAKVFLITLLVCSFVGLSEAANNSPRMQKAKFSSRAWKVEQFTISELDPVGANISAIVENPITALVDNLVGGTVIGSTTYNRATCYMGRNLAVGTDGVIHASWCDRNNLVTYYSRSTDGGETWMDRVVVNDVLEGDRTSIAVDPTNPKNIFVIYNGRRVAGEDRWVHVRKSTDGGMTWLPSVIIDAANHNPISNDIIVDYQGNPHALFDNNNDNHIYYNYSTDGGATWLPFPEIVDIGAAGGAGFGPAIALDKNNNPHVLFGNDNSPESWGDKNMYWTWRDNNVGFWMEIPPVQLCSGGTGLGWGTMVVDSEGNIHAWYDDSRVMQYRMYNGSSWSEPETIPQFNPEKGGNQGMCSAAIDANDNLYVIYKDASTPNGSGNAWDGYMDVFSGTNISGDWQYVNITRVDAAHFLNYCDVAREVLADGVVHMIYTDLPSHTSGDADPITHTDGRVLYVRAYPWPPEPESSVDQLSDTYYKSNTYTVTSTTGDIDGFVVACSLYVWKNGQPFVGKEMSQLQTNQYETDFTIEGEVGDLFEYQSVAIDNDGYRGPSSLLSFTVREPNNPNAGVLLVDDDGRIPSFYTDILDELGYYYEIWDIDDFKGIDASITDFGWKTIFVYGWVIASVPTRDYTDDPFAGYLQAGTTESPRNLALLSQDYFYGQGEAAGDVIFDPGDFAYDFFQLGGGTNDPDQTANDSVLIGVQDDPISGSFADTPFEFDNDLFQHVTGVTGNPNWIDWTGAIGEGIDIFYAYNQGFGAGVRYDAGNFKTVMLPWMVSMLIDSVITETDTLSTPKPEAITLFQNILDWFGSEKGEPSSLPRKAGENTPTSFALHPNYPNPFNPQTTISYDLPKNVKVDLAVYNVMGQKIRTLVNKTRAEGSYTVTWDGKDDAGNQVTSGVYFYKIVAGDFVKSHKMLLVK